MDLAKAKLPILGLLAVGLLFLGFTATYIVPEGHQAVITQFGDPIGEPRTEAGLYFKMPFVQKVRMLDKRLLTWDGNVEQNTTRDLKILLIDMTARWRIADPIQFIKRVQTMRQSLNRIDTILDSATKDVIAAYPLVDVVRNSNRILEQIAEIEELRKKGELDLEEEQIIGEIEKVEFGRERLSELIREKAAPAMIEQLGVELIDVQLRRVNYEDEIAAAVFERMISERQRIAERIRSVGQGQRASIEGKINKDLQEIESAAYRTAQGIRGRAEAEATRIYATALKQDPDFYQFMRTMEAYGKAFPKSTRFILSTNSDFLKKLENFRTR